MNFILPSVSTSLMGAVLKEFAFEAELGPKRRAIVVLDGAGWHTAKDLVVPDGVHLVFLPPYSPELQPAERIWPIVNEAVANRYFRTLEELEGVLDKRCEHLDTHPDYVHRVTRYHWWPEEPSIAE